MEQPHPGGRPTDYKPEYCETVNKLALLGLTDSQMANLLEVSEVTFNAWKKKHPEFLKSLKDGKEIADASIAKSLYKKALGYDYHGKHYPADTTAIIFWLKNRQPKGWRDKQPETDTTDEFISDRQSALDQ